VPFLVNYLEPYHFVIVVEQPLIVKVPDPELFLVVAEAGLAINSEQGGGHYDSLLSPLG
jgi:hypothetical protein